MVYYCTCVAYFCCGSSEINRQRHTHWSLNYHEYLIRGRKWEKETKLKLDTIIEAYWDRWRGSSCAVFSLLAVSIFVSISKWTLISWRQWCVEACFLFLPVLSVLALHLERSGKPLCSFVQQSTQQCASSHGTWMDTLEFISVCKVESVVHFTSHKYVHNGKAARLNAKQAIAIVVYFHDFCGMFGEC